VETSLLLYIYDRFKNQDQAWMLANTVIIENPDHGFVAKLVSVGSPTGKNAAPLSAVPHP